MMTFKGGTSQACAACKYQRRKCASDCALAPYFPADKPKMFKNAHRLFGVCNIMKILKQLREDQKEEAMKSIIYESDMRQRFPVFGCSLVIWHLREQLGQLQEELCRVNSCLAIAQYNKQLRDSGQITADLMQQLSCPPSEFQLGSIPSNTHLQRQSNVDMYSASNKFLVSDNDAGYVESTDVKPFWLQQQQQQQQHANNYDVNGLNSSTSSLEVKQFMIPQCLPFQQDIDEVSHDYDDMPLDTIAHDRQSYIESKDACESSVESTLKDSIHSVDIFSQNHELKSAAACFTLTSVN